jgi:hypothetical protein
LPGSVPVICEFNRVAEFFITLLGSVFFNALQYGLYSIPTLERGFATRAHVCRILIIAGTIWLAVHYHRLAGYMMCASNATGPLLAALMELVGGSAAKSQAHSNTQLLPGNRRQTLARYPPASSVRPKERNDQWLKAIANVTEWARSFWEIIRSVMKNSATRLNSQITGTEPGKMTHWEPLQVVFEP